VRLDIENLLNSPMIYSVSYFNLGGLGFVRRGKAHQSSGGFKGGAGWAIALPDFWFVPA